jgi:hypothetical protein
MPRLDGSLRTISVTFSGLFSRENILETCSFSFASHHHNSLPASCHCFVQEQVVLTPDRASRDTETGVDHLHNNVGSSPL